MAAKKTGPKAAKNASKVLRDKGQDKPSKSAAGSSLSQVEKSRKKAK
jgi:hypothetical protein